MPYLVRLKEINNGIFSFRNGQILNQSILNKY